MKATQATDTMMDFNERGGAAMYIWVRRPIESNNFFAIAS
jgi:hypothetical protein